MTARIPPLLSPYIAIPPANSLTLLTGLLGASPNWLILRYLYAALGNPKDKLRGQQNHVIASDVHADEQEDVAVVLVSWMRDFEFWKVEARRSVGLDLLRLQQENRFLFIDGLTRLFVPAIPADLRASRSLHERTSILSSTASPLAESKPPISLPRPSPTNPRSSNTSTTLPDRRRPGATREPSSATTTRPSHPSSSISEAKTNAQSQASQPSSVNPNREPSTGPIYLTSSSLVETKNTILATINSLKSNTDGSASGVNGTKKIILILDHPHLLLSLQEPPPTNTSNSSPPPPPTLSSILPTLLLSAHSTVIALPADDPFLDAALHASTINANTSASHHSQTQMQTLTPLDIETAAFVVSCAQMARYVIGCRRLGTGWAGDVSGVVRATRGGAWDGEVGPRGDGGVGGKGGLISGNGRISGRGGDDAEEGGSEGEWLYFVGGDGSVKVWSRGGSAQ